MRIFVQKYKVYEKVGYSFIVSISFFATNAVGWIDV